MAITALPIDASSGAPAYTAQQTREVFSALTGVAPAGRPLGASSGVRPGTPSSTVALSGSGNTTWTVRQHAGVLDVESALLAGPYLYACDGTDTGTLNAADATNPRVDIICVGVNDTVQDGSGLRGGFVSYVAGSPAASPSAPATPSRAMVLAQVNVPKSGGGNPTVTWVAPAWDARPGFRASKASTQSVPTGTDTTVQFGTTVYSSGTIWAGTSPYTTAVVQVAGWYHVFTDISVDDINTGSFLTAYIMQNGQYVAANGLSMAVNTAASDHCSVSVPLYCNVGDQLTVVVNQNGGSTGNIDGTIREGCVFSAVRIGS